MLLPLDQQCTSSFVQNVGPVMNFSSDARPTNLMTHSLPRGMVQAILLRQVSSMEIVTGAIFVGRLDAILSFTALV